MTIIYATPDELEALSMGERDRRDARRRGRAARHAGRALRPPARSSTSPTKIGSPHDESHRRRRRRERRRRSTRRSASVAPIRGAPRWRAPASKRLLGIRPHDIGLGQARRTAPLAARGAADRAARRRHRRLDLDAGGADLRMVLPEAQALGIKPRRSACRSRSIAARSIVFARGDGRGAPLTADARQKYRSAARVNAREEN